MIEFLVTLIVLCLVLYLLFYILGQIALPQPVRTVITVLAALIVLLWMVQRYGLL
jgi:hypothetical protein